MDSWRWFVFLTCTQVMFTFLLDVLHFLLDVLVLLSSLQWTAVLIESSEWSGTDVDTILRRLIVILSRLWHKWNCQVPSYAQWSGIFWNVLNLEHVGLLPVNPWMCLARQSPLSLYSKPLNPTRHLTSAVPSRSQTHQGQHQVNIFTLVI
jgi:hypothetical protein